MSQHLGIAGRLGENGCRADAGLQCVAPDAGLGHHGQARRNAVAVDKCQLRRKAQALQGAAHGQQGCLQYVDGVYLDRFGAAQ